MRIQALAVAGQSVAPASNRRVAGTGPAPRDRPSIRWLSLAPAPCAWSLEPMEGGWTSRRAK
jgi:hypothetical protein